MPAKREPTPQPYTMLLAACEAFAALGLPAAAEPASPASGNPVFAGESPTPGVLQPPSNTRGKAT